MLKIRRYFVTGLLLVLPIFISFYVFLLFSGLWMVFSAGLSIAILRRISDFLSRA